MVNNRNSLAGRFSSGDPALKQTNAQGGLQFKPKDKRKKKSRQRRTREQKLARTVRSGNLLPWMHAGPSEDSQAFGDYLKSIVNPRDYVGVRLPDQRYSVRTATYQSKFDFKVTGIAQTAATSPTGNAGRFCYVFQPKISQATGGSFTTSHDSYAVIYQDGTATGAAALWVPFMSMPDPVNNFTKVAQDPRAFELIAASTGVAVDIRPVSMAVLASFSGNLTQGAGDLAIHLLSGNSWTRLVTNTSLTNLDGVCGWEGLASTVPATYRGPLTKGGFCFWKPYSEGDEILRTVEAGNPNSHELWEYPIIVISGQNGNTANPPPECLSLQCWVNYEYTTENKLISTLPSPLPTGELALVQRLLHEENVSMANDFHDQFIKGVVGALAGFVAGGPVGAALGGAAGYFGSNLIGSAIPMPRKV